MPKKQLNLDFYYGQNSNLNEIKCPIEEDRAKIITAIRENNSTLEMADNVASFYIDIDGIRYLITPQLASKDNSGLVSINDQTFAGKKEFVNGIKTNNIFTDDITVSNLIEADTVSSTRYTVIGGQNSPYVSLCSTDANKNLIITLGEI